MWCLLIEECKWYMNQWNGRCLSDHYHGRWSDDMLLRVSVVLFPWRGARMPSEEFHLRLSFSVLPPVLFKQYFLVRWGFGFATLMTVVIWLNLEMASYDHSYQGVIFLLMVFYMIVKKVIELFWCLLIWLLL